jgi:asparagine N-glycosylation enzyme membrane subunit Stt3
LDEDETRKKLSEIEERKKVLAQGEKEFSKGKELLNKEESELRKEMTFEKKAEAAEGRATNFDKKWKGIFGNPSENNLQTYLFYSIAVLLIFVAAIYLRSTLLKYWGFYEPDDFYHFSVIRAAVNNNFLIPVKLGLSGWPQPSDISEPRGLYWVTLIPYFFLRFLGISYYNIMRNISLVFGLLDMLGAYLLARLLSKDKFFLLLVLVLVALSSGDAARTSALIYRGDSFVTIFLIIALLFLVYLFKAKSSREKTIWAILSGLFLSLTNFVWNGSPFVTIIYLVTVMLVLIFSFVRKKEKLLNDFLYVLLALGVWFIGVNALIFGGQITFGAQSLSGLEFLPIYAFLCIGWFVAQYITKKNYFESGVARLALIIAVVLLGIVAIYAIEPALVINVVLNNGLIVTSSFTATIQELTPPTYSFLFASFGYALYTSPVTILMTLPSVVLQGVSALSVLRTELDFVFWIIMLLGFIPYLFMKVYDSEGFLSGNARWRLGVDVEMIVLAVYFAITAFLQIYAIRFNSLVAVPLAIFGAYTIYWLTLFSKRFNLTRILGMIALFFILLLILNSTLEGTFGSSLVFPMVSFVLAALAAVGVYLLAKSTNRYEVYCYAITIVLVMVLLYYDIIFSANVSPADSMNPSLFSAMTWLKNNSAANSVVLTLWPDGSVVEGVANRTSVMDSVGSQNSQKADPFALWLFNSSGDPGFLTSSNIGSPNYLLVRYVWLYGESVGIFQESGINSSQENGYAFAPLSSFNEFANSTTEIFKFSSGSNGQGINAVAQVYSNNTLRSYIDEGNGQISPFTYVAFDDQSTGNFSVVKQTAFNTTNNQLLLIQYSEVPNQQLKLNITNAAIFAQGMADSNLLKFLYFCNARTCLWNNNVASLQLVYANSDTKIFKITYNSTT